MDENEKASSIIQQATDQGATGPELRSHLIREIHEALHEGEDPKEVAERVWPRVVSLVSRTTNAAELGRRGGRKGGKARAEKLTPEERSEIARKAANARWGKTNSE